MKTTKKEGNNFYIATVYPDGNIQYKRYQTEKPIQRALDRKKAYDSSNLYLSGNAERWHVLLAKWCPDLAVHDIMGEKWPKSIPIKHFQES